MDKKTKIVATIGPASDSAETIEELIKSGVDIFRFNTKHNVPNWHSERIDRVQRIANKLKMPIGIMLDLQGPEMRIDTREGEDVLLKKGETIDIYRNFKRPSAQIALPYKTVFRKLSKGDHILIEDAFVELEVVSKRLGKIVARAIDDCTVHHRKGVNLPGINIDLPSLTERDYEYLEIIGKSKVDFVALSFIRDTKDIKILRNQLQKHNLKSQIVAKIENSIALENIASIVDESDVVMVARGDLGVEVPIEELAFWQNTIIELCRQKNKPVITATQMLESMIQKPYPTRSEATDIANAIANGTDAIMLSGETAAGKYPVRAVQVMAKIAAFNEKRLMVSPLNKKVSGKTDLFTKLAVDVAYEENVSTNRFLVFTQTGKTARSLSSLRPNVEIIAVTESQKTVETLTISYGVRAYKIKFPKGKIRNPEYPVRQLLKKGILKKGETIILIHGSAWKIAGSTNTLSVIQV